MYSRYILLLLCAKILFEWVVSSRELWLVILGKNDSAPRIETVERTVSDICI